MCHLCLSSWVTDFSLQKLKFSFREILVGLSVDKVVLGQVFLQILLLTPVILSFHQCLLPIFLYQGHCMVYICFDYWTINSSVVVKQGISFHVVVCVWLPFTWKFLCKGLKSVFGYSLENGWGSYVAFKHTCGWWISCKKWLIHCSINMLACLLFLILSILTNRCTYKIQ